MITRVILIQTYVFMLGCGLVMLGIFSGVDFFLQTDPGLASVLLLPDSALLSILLGAMLLGSLSRSVWWRLLPASGVAALCVYSLLHSWLAGGEDQGVSAISGFLRMRDSLALIMLLPALAQMATNRPGRWAARAVAAVMLLVALFQFAGMLGQAVMPVWAGFKFSTNLMAMLMIGMIGLAVLGQSLLQPGASFFLSRLSLAVGIAAAFAAGLTWHQLSQSDVRHLQASGDRYLDAAEQSLTRSLDARIRLMQRMGERLELNGALLSEATWDQESASYLRDHPDLQFIALLNQQSEVVMFKQTQGASSAVIKQLLTSFKATAGEARGAIADENKANLQSLSGSYGLLLTPLAIGIDSWILASGLDLRILVSNDLGYQLRPFELRIERSGQTIVGPSGKSDFLPVQSRSLSLKDGESWQLAIMVSRNNVAGPGGALAAIQFVFILLVGMLLIITQRMTNLAMQRNQLLRRLTVTLRSNNQHQAELHAFNEQMMRHSQDLLCAFDARGGILRVSHSVNIILGYAPGQMQGHSAFEFIVPEDRIATDSVVGLLKTGKSIGDFRNRYRHRDGHQVDMMWSAVWDSESQMLFCVGRDVTAMAVQERFAEDQRGVLAMISASRPLPLILDTLCHMVERRLPGCRASIAMVRPESATMTVLSAPSLPPLYQEAVNGTALAEGSCACATAAYRGEGLFIEDVAESALWADYREVALAEGLRSCWCMPMMSQNNTVLGTLSLYSRELAVAGADERVMLACTQLAALALEREQDQVQLKTSEQRYRSLFTHNPDAVFSFDLTGAFTSMNEAGYALIGMTPEGLLGKHFSALVDGRDLADLSASFTRSLGGVPVRYEARVHSAKGEILELDISNLPMVVDGEVVGIFGIAKDLHGIKEARRELERQLSFTQTVTNSLQDGLIATDVQGQISFANPAALALLDRQPSNETVHLSQWVPLDPVRWAAELAPSLTGEFEQRRAGDVLRIAYQGVRLRSDDDDAGWVITFRDRTTELKAGRALAERDQFFSLSLDMFCMISLKGLFVQLNPAMIQALGYREAEIVDQPYPSFLVPADRARAEAAMNKLAQGQGIADLDLRVRTADGRVIMMQLNAALGEDRIVYVVARDVTEQRAVNTVIEQHHALLQIAGSIARIGGWIIDLQSNTIVLSDEVCAIHQLPSGSIIDLERVVDQYAPEYHRELRSKLKKCMQQGESYEMRCEALNASGERIWVRLMGKALRNQEGEITRIQGAVQDISDIIRAENELHRLATRMQNILTSITDAFFSLDSDWRFTYVNQQAETLLERSADELLGGDVWKLFPEARGSEIYPRYIEAVTTKQSQHFEVYSQELRRWLEMSAYPFEDGLSVFFRDIGERKQGEERLSAAMIELERSNRELQDFAFIASHDLQEPLRKVQAFGERLEQRSTQLDDTGRDYLQRMRQASGRMQHLIQDLLMYSRVATRAGDLSPVPLDSVLDEVLLDLETAIDSNEGIIEREPLTTVQGDTRQLGQALQNLLSNALKFHRKNVSPLIRVYGETAEDGSWTLCVADNGIGFDEKYLDRIFNPFQRLHDRQQFSGTGIGLAIVRKIIERHQAVITARSEPGVGSTFRITFPPASVYPAGKYRTPDSRTAS